MPAKTWPWNAPVALPLMLHLPTMAEQAIAIARNCSVGQEEIVQAHN